MKNTRFIIFLHLFVSVFLYSVNAQTKVFAYLKDEFGKPVERATVDLMQSSDDQIADKIGYFQFVGLSEGNYQFTVSKAGLETRVIRFTLKPDEKEKDLGVISLRRASQTTDVAILILDDAASDHESKLLQSSSNLLATKREVFQKNANLELAQYWFRVRGLDTRYEEVLFNGVSVSNDLYERQDPVTWAGLNDITRIPYQTTDLLSSSNYSFGKIGGTQYYSTRASNFQKETTLTYSNLNRNYKNRLMATYASGLSPSGWAFVFSGSRRWGEDGFINGLEQDSYAYFGAIEKKVSDRFSVNVTAFGSPSLRDSYSASTQGVYELLGKDYNAYWGYDQGEVRNSRRRSSFEPVFQVQTYHKIGKNSNLNNTLSYQFGRNAQSRLDFQGARSPNPTDFINVPQGLTSRPNGNTDWQDEQISNWINDPAEHQLNWDYFREVNKSHPDMPAQYFVVEDVIKNRNLSLFSHFDTQLSDNWQLNLNLSYQHLTSINFRVINDLLDAPFVTNRDLNSGESFNIAASDTKLTVGDITRYNYNLSRDRASFNVSTRANIGKWDLMTSFLIGYTNSQRDGKYQNSFYPEVSFGKSNTFNSIDAGVKAKLSFSPDKRNKISYTGAIFSLSPTLEEIFINPRLSNYLTPNLTNQTIQANELRYLYDSSNFRLRVSGFYNNISNAIQVSRTYGEEYEYRERGENSETFVTEVLSGVDKSYKGIEVGAELRVLPSLNLFAIGSFGDYTYDNNPEVFLSNDSSRDPEGSIALGEARIKNYHIAGTAQKAASLGFRFNHPKLWWLGGSANFLADKYLDFFAANRTESFYINPHTQEPYQSFEHPQFGHIPGASLASVDKLLEQKSLDNQWLFNIDAGKTFNLGRYRLGISVSVINLLNNRDYITGGYEQHRISNYPTTYFQSQLEKPLSGPRVWYDRGRSYFGNIFIKF